jgi:hypothetical protein
MKLTIAASILLVQTTPTLSRKRNVDVTRVSKQERDHDDDSDSRDFFDRVVAAINGPTGHHDRATLGSKKSFFTPRAAKRRWWKNKAHSASTTSTSTSTRRNCDPLSTDPDVGLLSCGLGYDCVADQESNTLGGLCTAITRELQTATTCDLCGDSGILAYSKSNNSVVVDGMDNIATCQDLYYAVYYTGIENDPDNTTCSALATVVATTADCCSLYCDLCGDGAYMSRYNFNISLNGPINGVNGSTCEAAFLAAYRSGRIAEDSCPSAGEAVRAAGCCAPPNCTFGTPCGKGCCSSSSSSYSNCSICGDAAFYNDNEVVMFNGTFNTTCYDIQPYLTEEQCNMPEYVQACCSSSSSTNPPKDPAGTSGSTTPTTAPEPSPSPPSSASSTRTTTPSWSSRTTTLVVSMMTSLTVATAAGALMLN